MRRRRPSVDWVQNDQSYTEFTTEVSADDTVLSAVLVYSKQTQMDTIGFVGTPVLLQAGAFPNRVTRQRVRRVVGEMFWQPVETWTSGSVREFAMRIVKMKMNPEDQVAVVNNPGYTLNSQLVAGGAPYVWADARFLWEKRDVRFFNLNQTTSTRDIYRVFVDWRGVETLEDDEGLFLLVQNASLSSFGTAGNIRLQTWLRSLCDVESR